MKNRKKPFIHAILHQKLLFPFIAFFNLLSLSATSQDSTTVKEEFKPSGKIWGYAFGDYAYKLHADSAKRGNVQYSRLPKNYNSFNFRRIYFGFDYQFTPNISSQFLLAHESSFEASPDNTDELTNNNSAVYIKTMNIRFANVIPRAVIVAGQQATPTFATLSESFWGFRSIEKTIADMRRVSTSTDLGVGVFGKIGKNENGGYDVLIGNGNGAKLENNTFKKIYTSFYFYFFEKRLVIQANYEHDRIASSPVRQDISNFKIFAGYKTSKTSIGTEAFTQVKTNNTLADSIFTNVIPVGISFFLTHQTATNKVTFFARLDYYNPDKRFNKNKVYAIGYNSNNEIFATIGVDFIPAKNVHLMPNLWYNKYKSKLPGALGKLKSDQDFEARMTVYFLFNQ